MENEELPALVDRLVAAINRGDADAFLRSFTSNGLVNDWGSSYLGRDAIRRWSEREFIGKRVTLRVSTMCAADDQVGVQAHIGGPGFNGPRHFVFVVEAGQVREMHITA